MCNVFFTNNFINTDYFFNAKIIRNTYKNHKNPSSFEPGLCVWLEQTLILALYYVIDMNLEKIYAAKTRDFDSFISYNVSQS